LGAGVKTLIASGLMYFAVIAFTYGWTYHRDCTSEWSRLYAPAGIKACAGLAGVVWPIYWSMKAATYSLEPRK
jgi:hypothetical protein